MALKFNCSKCNSEIEVKFLRVGETAKCKNCGMDNLIPETAIEAEPSPPRLIERDIELPTGKGRFTPGEKLLGVILILEFIYLIFILMILFAAIESVSIKIEGSSLSNNIVALIMAGIVAYLIASILGILMNKKWAWWLNTTLFMLFPIAAVFSLIGVIVSISDKTYSASAGSIIANCCFLAPGIIIFLLSLNRKVMEVFSLEKLSRVRAILLMVGIYLVLSGIIALMYYL